MRIHISDNKTETGAAAARQAAAAIRAAIAEREQANIILATGASQFEMLSYLVVEDIDWAQGHRLPPGRVHRPAREPPGQLPPLPQGALYQPSGRPELFHLCRR